MTSQEDDDLGALMKNLTLTDEYRYPSITRSLIHSLKFKLPQLVLSIIGTDKENVEWKFKLLLRLYSKCKDTGVWNKQEVPKFDEVDNGDWEGRKNASPFAEMRYCSGDGVVCNLKGEKVDENLSKDNWGTKFRDFYEKWVEKYQCSLSTSNVIYMIFVKLFGKVYCYAGKAGHDGIKYRFLDANYSHARKSGFTALGYIDVYSDFVIGLADPKDVLICAFDAVAAKNRIFCDSHVDKQYYKEFSNNQDTFLEQVFINYSKKDNTALTLNHANETSSKEALKWMPDMLHELCINTEKEKQLPTMTSPSMRGISDGDIEEHFTA